MYDKVLTAAAVDAVSERQGWPLTYHSSTAIRSAISHFDDLKDEETGALARPLTPDEQRFIQNERRLCKLDFRYYGDRYATLIGWDKQVTHFHPNIAQAIVLDIWSEMERASLAILIVQLKARQLGMSLLSELAIAHRVQFYPRTNAAIASADPKKTVEMGKMIRYCWENMPWWLMPVATKEQQGMPVEFGDLNSSIMIQAGNQFHGVARGATPDCFHLSELSSWADAASDVDAALLKAVHPTPGVFGILESTALGRANWWYDNWQAIKVDWPLHRTPQCPLFLPWFVGTDIYPTDTWLRAVPIPANWAPSDRTVHHAERARAYVLGNPLLFEHLAHGDREWRLPRRQLWFYEVERETALKKKALNLFLSEMPSDDLEAFQNTQISVIDQDVILDYRERVQPPLGVYAIVGTGIHRALIPPQHLWDPTQPPITVNVSSLLRSPEVYQFIPLRFEGYPGYDPMFKLFIWEWPEDGEEYGIGTDTSDGIGQDWSVLEVLRKAQGDRCHGQVAEFASPYIKADQLWPMALALGTFYSVIHARAGRRTQCRQAVECRGNGEIVQLELKKRGWVNFHPWKRYDNKKRTPDAQVHKEGVFTNVWFRAMMVDKFLTLVDEQAMDIRSPWLVNELETLERDPEESSARAAYNTHDDRFMAMGFALFSLTVDERPTLQYRRSVPQYLPEPTDDQVRAATSYPTYRPGPQAFDNPVRVAQALASRPHRGALRRYVNLAMPEGFR
jgi:hypothetical protein